ncbi:uncharacterized protein LOC119370681 [Jatropha curcas]|uniref:uncharacterized protein LOC119370681 n=1 Tax=Jatropha curcas TaxID=180498 RepID=UPI00189380E7|nr:uncharacterized protein LOC119370681 [Jatropha curcas]
MTDFEEKLIKSPEPSFEQLVEGTEFMVGMVQTGDGTEWSQKLSEFEDFLGIGDEASKMAQEQKAKARILQSVLAAEDAKEAEGKVLKMAKLEEEKAKAVPEAEEAPHADEVIQAIKNSCDECIEQAINPVLYFLDFCFENNLDVPVLKKDGRIRVCVDYRDLNKASPKDDFPFPHIDVFIDSAAGMGYYSIMDGFSGYNQILMALVDKHKTAFTMDFGTFCYRVMPFGLKNVGATY